MLHIGVALLGMIWPYPLSLLPKPKSCWILDSKHWPHESICNWLGRFVKLTITDCWCLTMWLLVVY